MILTSLYRTILFFLNSFFRKCPILSIYVEI